MKKYYYICPRCGRRWRYFIPRTEMKCKFCSEEWNTKERKRLSSSRFSWGATFLWLFWLALIVGVVYYFFFFKPSSFDFKKYFSNERPSYSVNVDGESKDKASDEKIDGEEPAPAIGEESPTDAVGNDSFEFGVAPETP